MQKLRLEKPIVILTLGYPGAGKSYMARQLSESLGIPRINADRIRYELFEHPTFSRDEDLIVYRLFDYMVEEHLKVGNSIICDGDFSLRKSRHLKYEAAREYGHKTLVVWVRTDLDTSFSRASTRSNRRIDDQYSPSIDERTFSMLIQKLKKPEKENFVVVSGKHVFKIQRDTIARKLKMLGVLTDDQRVVPRSAEQLQQTIKPNDKSAVAHSLGQTVVKKPVQVDGVQPTPSQSPAASQSHQPTAPRAQQPLKIDISRKTF